MRYLRELSKDYLKGKTCLLRVDLNTEPDDQSLRINAVVPTIRFLLDKGASPLIISHRGRPTGVDLSLSLRPIINVLEKKVGQKLNWLENLRFDPREQANDKSLAKELAAKGDFYVNDAFAVSHRQNASVVSITEFLPSFAGLLLEEEIKILTKVRDNPEQPLVVIIGGIKLEDKLSVINNLKKKSKKILMGSAYFKFKQELTIDNDNILFPQDFSDNQQLDIGPKTINLYSQEIKRAKTVIWNGPLGKFEDERYRQGSQQIAQAIINTDAFSIAGGGDTEKLLQQLGLIGQFSFVSTGGGAMLMFLAGEKLPGLAALGMYN